MEKQYSEEVLEKAISSLPYEVTIQDINGKIIFANDVFINNIKMKKENIIGKKPEQLLSKEANAYVNKAYEKLLQNKKGVFFEIKQNKKDNKAYDLYKAMIEDKGKEYIVSMLRESNLYNIYDSFYYSKEKDSNDVLGYANMLYDKKNNEISYSEFLNILELLCNNIQYRVKADGIKLYIINDKLNNMEMLTQTGEVLEVCKDLKNRMDKLILNNDREKLANFEKMCSQHCSIFMGKNKNCTWHIRQNLIKYGSKIIGVFVVFYKDKNKIKYEADDFIKSVCYKLGILCENMRIRQEQVQLQKENMKMQNALELENLKTEFFANMSHEFRTPLNIIVTSTQLIDMQLKNNDINKINRNLKYIKQNSYRLLKLVNNILDITKIDNGRYDLNLEDCNIVETIETIVSSVVDYVKSFNNNILFDTDEEEVILACDREKIERIMLNLLSNALKYIDSGGKIKVNLTTEREKGRVLVHVWDNGIKISEEDGRKIFDRFKRIDNLLTRKCEGGGIGLALTKSLVELHGGEIWTNTNVSEGAEIIFTLPIKRLDKRSNNEVVKKTFGAKIERCNIEFSDIYSIN